MFDLCGKILHRLIQCIARHHPVFHDLKSLIFQPFHLLLSGIGKIHALCLHQGKCIKTHMTLCCDLIV